MSTTVAGMAARAIPPALEETKAVQVPLRRLRAAEARLAAAQADFDDARRGAVEALVAAGLSYAQVAGLLGVTKSRAFQISRGSR